LVASALGQVPGLGPVRQKVLLQTFASLEELRGAGVEELRTKARLPLKVAQDLKDWLGNQEKQKPSELPVYKIKEMRD
jgi:excinuclease UvrABC nuclease subunit